MLLLSLLSRLTARCTHAFTRRKLVQAHDQALTAPAVGRRDAHRPLQGLLVSLS